MKSKKRDFIRMLVGADSHCGSRAGLTPPDHWQHGSAYYGQQQKTWKFYEDTVNSLKPIDIFVFNGDAIDGKGAKSGGTEIYEADRHKQVDIAAECFKIIDADVHKFIVGTSYHVGVEEDFEHELARRFEAELEGHAMFEVKGVTFDCKHHIGSSTIPHGRYTNIAKHGMWNKIWADRGGQPRADVTIRSHVHYFDYCGTPDWLGVITPALQGFGSKFGVRQCEGVVDFGLIWFDIYDDASKYGRKYDFGYKIMEYEVVKQKEKFESRLRG